MKKRIVMLCSAMLLVLASTVTAYAEERQGEAGWEVVFDGSDMKSNFSPSDMDDEIYNMQPGDTVELTITLKNATEKETDWYMRNEVLQTLEDASKAEGGAYDYLLTYTNSAEELTELYSSEYFGGEGIYGGMGLKSATKTLDEYVHLERMAGGNTGTVKLKVRLDGETQGNSYQNTLARLQMDFAVEQPESGPGGRRPVRTGDQTKIMLYVVLTLVAGMTLLVIAVLRLRGEREESVVADAPNKNRKTGKRRLS